MIKRGKVVKLNSGLVSKLDDIRDPTESYSVSISKLIGIADLVDVRLPRMQELK